MSDPILKVRDLSIEFSTDRGKLRALDRISFDVFPGETLAVVGESGCGKSITALAILGLIAAPAGKIIGGSIQLNGRELVGLPESKYRKVRGSDISMIFQEPMTALNPVFTVANQMTDVLMRHKKLTRKQARTTAIDMLARVGIASPEKRVDEYPHQLSGGMRQRVMIAMALSCGPQLLIADEPTTALDVTTQAQVMEQMVNLQEEFGTAVMLITHDLGVVAQACQRVLVMYCGRLIEQGEITTLFKHPLHPYTHGLLHSIPRIREHKLELLPTIPGSVPDLLQLPEGCYFRERCQNATEQCLQTRPDLQVLDSGRQLACHHPLAASESA